MPNPMTEYMEIQLKKQTALDMFLVGLNLVIEDGIEGIQTAAQTQPDLIIVALTNLVEIVHAQQVEINALSEQLASIYDICEEYDPAQK